MAETESACNRTCSLNSHSWVESRLIFWGAGAGARRFNSGDFFLKAATRFAEQSMGLAFFFRDANEKYATDYPAAVGNHMVNTDSNVFMNIIPAISLRENERGMQIGAGWNPHYHQATDRYSSYSDKDFRLGLNAAQTTLAAIARLTGATVKK